MSSLKAVVETGIPPEPDYAKINEEDDTETEEEEKTQSAEIPKISKISKKSKAEKAEKEETEDDEDDDEDEDEEQEKKTGRGYVPKHLFRNPLDRPLVLVYFQFLLEILHLENWNPDWTNWIVVKQFVETKASYTPNMKAKIGKLINALIPMDTHLYGIQTYVYILYCQLNPSVTPFKSKYLDAYFIFCNWMQLLILRDKNVDSYQYPFVTVDSSTASRNIIQKYFFVRANEVGQSPLPSSLNQLPSLSSKPTSAATNYFKNLPINASEAYVGNTRNIKGCAALSRRKIFSFILNR